MIQHYDTHLLNKLTELKQTLIRIKRNMLPIHLQLHFSFTYRSAFSLHINHNSNLQHLLFEHHNGKK